MGHSNRPRLPALLALPGALALLLALAAGQSPGQPGEVAVLWPESGGVRVEHLDTIRLAERFRQKRWFNRVFDFLVGAPTQQIALNRPQGVAATSEGVLFVTDPSLPGVHRFDLEKRRHKVLQGPRRRRLVSPVGLCVDSRDRVYVTDSELGMLMVFDDDGDFKHLIGEFGGEGMFKRPTGIAFDSAASEIYVTDTLRHKVYVLDGEGNVRRSWGERGYGNGQFNFPIGVAVAGDRVYVLDSLNARVQVFDRRGGFVRSFGERGLGPGRFFRPKGLTADPARGVIYVSDGLTEVVQAFSLEGELLFAFGGAGGGAGQFQLVAGMAVDTRSRLLVADSLNRRVQILRRVPEGAARAEENR